MEEPLHPERSVSDSIAELSEALDATRRRSARKEDVQRTELQRIESDLQGKIETLSTEIDWDLDSEEDITKRIAREKLNIAKQREQLESKAHQLQENAIQVQNLYERILEKQKNWDLFQEQAEQDQIDLVERLSRKQAELESREKDIDELEAKIRRTQRSVKVARRELDEEAAELDETRKRFKKRRAILQEELEELAAVRGETRSQRKRIARQLKRKREQLLEEIKQHRMSGRLPESHTLEEISSESDSLRKEYAQAKWELKQLEAQLGESREEIQALESKLAESSAGAGSSRHRGRIAELEGQLQAALEQVAELETAADQQTTAADSQSQQLLDDYQRKLELALDDLRALKQRNAQLEEMLSQRPAIGDTEGEELARLRIERDQYLERISALETSSDGTQENHGLDEKLQESQRRFGLAVEEIRELKTECEQLRQQLLEVRDTGSSGSGSTVEEESLDWETQKHRLLAALENDFDEQDQEERDTKLTIEGTIQITDEVIAQKDREIKELQQLLDDQSKNIEGLAVGAAAVTDIFDQDEIIREERRRLTELQATWEEKVRQAEIDISLERAKIAREYSALEEQKQDLQAELARLDQQAGKPADKASRDRWLTRLGLKESDDEQ